MVLICLFFALFIAVFVFWSAAYVKCLRRKRIFFLVKQALFSLSIRTMTTFTGDIDLFVGWVGHAMISKTLIVSNMIWCTLGVLCIHAERRKSKTL